MIAEALAGIVARVGEINAGLVDGGSKSVSRLTDCREAFSRFSGSTFDSLLTGGQAALSSISRSLERIAERDAIRLKLLSHFIEAICGGVEHLFESANAVFDLGTRKVKGFFHFRDMLLRGFDCTRHLLIDGKEGILEFSRCGADCVGGISKTSRNGVELRFDDIRKLRNRLVHHAFNLLDLIFRHRADAGLD